MPHQTPTKALYPAIKPVIVALALVAGTSGCGLNYNPNFQTVFFPDAPSYTIEGSVTRGFSSRARVGYVQGESANPDIGSFRNTGPPDAGITKGGIYIPSSTISLDTNSRFHFTFNAKPRFAVIRIFCWDDTNGNNIRDLNEALASAEWDLKKNDQAGWTFNAPAWNQFNFSFSR